MRAGHVGRGLAAAVVIGLGLVLVAYVGYRSISEGAGEPDVASRPTGDPAVRPPEVLALAAVRPWEAEQPLPGRDGLLPGVPVRFAPLSAPERTVARAVTDRGGVATFRQLPPETLLAVARDDRYGVAGAVLGPEEPRTPRRGVLLLLGDGQTLEGRVVDASGAPVAGARIAVADLGEVLERLADPDGRFAFADLVPRDRILETYRESVGVATKVTSRRSFSCLGLRITKRETQAQPRAVPTAVRRVLDGVPVRVEAEGYLPWEERVGLESPVEVVLRTVRR